MTTHIASFDALAWFNQRNAELGFIFADASLWWDAAPKSREVALHLHRDQMRPGSDLPYVVHLIETAAFCATAALSDPVRFPDLARAVSVGWLHDSKEDQDAQAGLLVPLVGADGYQDIDALSKNPDLPKKEAMQDSLDRIIEAGIYAALGKVSDRSSNLLSDPPHCWTHAKKVFYQQEGRDILAQLEHLVPQWSIDQLTRITSLPIRDTPVPAPTLSMSL